MGSTTDWVDESCIAVLKKVGGIDFGGGTGLEERPEYNGSGVVREGDGSATALLPCQ